MIQHHVMKHQYRMALSIFIRLSANHTHRPKAEQRRLSQVHRQRRLIQVRPNALQFITFCSNFQRLRHQLRMPVHHLHRLRKTLPKDRRTQDIMPRHYPVHGPCKALELRH